MVMVMVMTMVMVLVMVLAMVLAMVSKTPYLFLCSLGNFSNTLCKDLCQTPLSNGSKKVKALP